MLSLANVSAAHGANYYKVENYYSQKDSVGFSKWTGLDAGKLGLEGAVDHRQFAELLKGTDPKIKVAGTAENRKRAGLDMTFSAPKSVSLQALVFGDHRLIAAHREAVTEALSYAEKNFAAYRTGGRNDRSVAKPGGFMVAQFEHDSSRLKDPQLHTHNVVLNRMENAQGEIRALHGDLFYKNSVLLGMIYQNSLAIKAQKLGYEIRSNASGTFELAGFSKEQLAVFSKRKDQIEAMNPESYRETRNLVLQNRKAKEGPQQREFLLESWQNEASLHNIRDLRRPSKTVSKKHPNANDTDSEKTMTQALNSVSTKSSVFRKVDALGESLQMSLGKFAITEHENSFEKHRERNVLDTKKDDIFTTRDAVKRDLLSREVVTAGIGTFEPMATEDVVKNRTEDLSKLNVQSANETLVKFEDVLIQKAIKSETIQKMVTHLNQALTSQVRVPLSTLTNLRQDLIHELKIASPKDKNIEKSVSHILKPLQMEFMAPTAGQKNAIEQTLLSKDKVILWQGVAGAGKTFALRQIVEAAQAAGYKVQGFAPSATAAMGLSKETHIATATLQSHILKRDLFTPEKSLWIVDEAGMISAKDFHTLQVKAQVQNARVLLVGDFSQLAPVDAGNPFLDIQKNTQTTVIRLTESLRQKDPILQAAASEMNRGDVWAGVRILNQKTLERSTDKGRQSYVVRKYLKKSESDREGTLLLTRTNRTRQDLTTQIREGLKEKGFLTNETHLPVLLKMDVPEARLKRASSYTAGDVLVPNRAYQSLGLQKDHQYEVVQVDTQKNIVTVQRSVEKGAQKIEIPVSRHSQFALFAKGTLPVAEGDKMIWNRNIKARGEINNGAFVVERVAKDGVLIRSESGHIKTLGPQEAQHMEHAWALTLYKAQGRTASDVLQLLDAGTTKRDLLVGVTRAENSVLLVAKSKAEVLQGAQSDPHKFIAVDEVSLDVVEQIKNEAKVTVRGMGR